MLRRCELIGSAVLVFVMAGCGSGSPTRSSSATSHPTNSATTGKGANVPSGICNVLPPAALHSFQPNLRKVDSAPFVCSYAAGRIGEAGPVINLEVEAVPRLGSMPSPSSVALNCSITIDQEMAHAALVEADGGVVASATVPGLGAQSYVVGSTDPVVPTAGRYNATWAGGGTCVNVVYVSTTNASRPSFQKFIALIRVIASRIQR